MQKAVCYYIYFSFKFRGIKVNYKQYITSLLDCFSVICQALSMPRQPRLDIPDLLHHVMVRGIERRVIFTDNTDFVERLRRLLPVGR